MWSGAAGRTAISISSVLVSRAGIIRAVVPVSSLLILLKLRYEPPKRNSSGQTSRERNRLGLRMKEPTNPTAPPTSTKAPDQVKAKSPARDGDCSIGGLLTEASGLPQFAQERPPVASAPQVEQKAGSDIST
jgi:hypothetical protein